MPREQCQQLRALGMVEKQAEVFERLYREEKEMELAGFRSELTPEEIFRAKVDEYKETKAKREMSEKKAVKEKAETKASSFKEMLLAKVAGPTLEEQVTERLRQERLHRAVPKKTWPKWEGENEENSAWPQWQKED